VGNWRKRQISGILCVLWAQVMAETTGKKKLTTKERRFVEEYLIDFNGTAAAIRAGYSEKTAATIASQNLRKLYIQAEIQRSLKDLTDKTDITKERILIEMRRLALFDVRTLYDEDGNPLPVHKLSDDAAAAINGLDVVSVGNAEVGVGQVMKYKIPDKNKALESLAKILGYLDRTTELERLQAEKLKRELAAQHGEDDPFVPANITIQAYDASNG